MNVAISPAPEKLFVPRPPRARYPAPLVVSLALHAGMLMLLAHTVVQLVPPPVPPIVVTLYEPLAAASPLGDAIASSVAAVAPPAVAQPESRPAVAKIPVRRKPARKPPSAPPAATEAEPAVAGDLANATGSSGDAGDEAGGRTGGQSGGSLGGRGDPLFRADEVASPPVVLSRTLPRYPPLARARDIEGLVVLETIIDRQGHIEHDVMTVIQSIPQLDEAAMTAVRQWRFKPGYDHHGEPVRVVLQVPIRFQLR